MSDRIGVMRAGRLVQVGTPEEIYSAPRDGSSPSSWATSMCITVMPNGDGMLRAASTSPGRFRVPMTASRPAIS